MRDADGTIERLLAGLRDAEPSAGIERRILEALDGKAARPAAASASLWRRLILPWRLRPAMAMSAACAGILAGSLIVLTVHQHRHVPADVSRSTNADARQSTGPEAAGQKAPMVPRRRASRVSVRRPGDVSAVGETQAAGFPAPPLPLTEQEKLLLRLAHRGDAKDMAILNPDVRAAQSAKATEQFQRFFGMNATEMRSQLE
jgi:hypothetical protein